MQGDQCHLWRTIEAHRRIDDADAPAGVDVQRTHAIQTGVIFTRQRWQNEWPHARKPNLSSMRVTGKLQVNRETNGVVGIIRLVRQQHSRLASRHSSQGGVHVGLEFKRIVNAGKPQALTVSLHHPGRISQHGDAAVC